MRFWFLVAALALAGCETRLSLFSRNSEPDYKKIVAGYLSQTFKDPTALRDITISGMRATTSMSGQVYRVCLRADVKDDITGQFAGIQTYALFIQNNLVTDRRRATPEDGCDAETFAPLTF